MFRRAGSSETSETGNENRPGYWVTILAQKQMTYRIRTTGFISRIDQIPAQRAQEEPAARGRKTVLRSAGISDAKSTLLLS